MTGDAENSHRPGAARAARRLARAGCSLWVGIALLAAIFLYLAVASVWPPPPGSEPGTPGALYAAWPLKLLGGLFVACLAGATFLRIPLRWPHIGAWASHAGVALLTAGSVWYLAGHESGVAVAGRDSAAASFAAVDRFFLDETAALYATAGGQGLAAGLQTPLGPLARADGPRRLATTAVTPFADVTATVTQYLPAAELTGRWRDDGPGELPAVEVVVHDGPHRFRGTLCPAYPFARQFGTRVYVVRFAAGLDEETLRGVRPPAGRDLVLVAPSGGDGAEVAVIGADGKRRGRHRVAAGKEVKLPLAGRKVGLTVARVFTRAWRAVEAYAAGRANLAAAVKLKLTVGVWRGSQWVPYSPYVRPIDAADAQLPRLPIGSGRCVFFHFAPQSKPLPRPFGVAGLDYRTYAGSAKARDYGCRLEVPAAGGGRAEVLDCRLNQPATIGGLRLYQNLWSPTPEAPLEIVFLVASRPGIGLIWAGCIVICLGMLYAFYVKPVLIRRQRGAAT